MDFNIESVFEQLKDDTPEQQRKAWDLLFMHHDHLTPAHLPLLHIALHEQKGEVKVYGTERLLAMTTGVLLRLRYPPRESSLHAYIWDKFLHSPGGTYDQGDTAVIGICDQSHIRDVPALLEVRGLLSKQAAPSTEFLTATLDNWHRWKEVPGDKYTGVCTVGRDSFFDECDLYEDWYERAQFKMPSYRKNSTAFGQVPDVKSKIAFHHISQRYGDYEIKFVPQEFTEGKEIKRVDYAVVRISHVERNGKDIKSVSLCGTTSLGTATAGHFAVNQAARYGWPDGLKVGDDIEVLLKARARVARDKQPWKIDDCRIVKSLPPYRIMKKDDERSESETESRSKPKGPSSVIIVLDDDDDVRDVLLDGLPPIWTKDDYDLLRAVFGAWLCLRGKSVLINDIRDHPSFPESVTGTVRQAIYDRLIRDGSLTGVLATSNDGIQIETVPCVTRHADLPGADDEEQCLQQKFENKYIVIRKGEIAPQKLLKDYGVIMFSDGAEEPTIVRLRRCGD